MKISSISFLFLFCIKLYSQSYCDNLSFEGIYYNVSDDQRMFLVLSNKGTNNEPSNSNYTNILIVTDNGDTISSSNLTYEHTLPTIPQEKIIYPLSIHSSFESFRDIPTSYSGTIQTLVPECTLSFTYTNEFIDTLPSDTSIECEDYSLVNIIKDRYTNIKYAYAVIHSTVEDSILLNTGYTSFEFFDDSGESLSYKTEPSQFLPSFPSDTLCYEMQFRTFVDSVLCGYLQLENPSCKLPFCNKITYLENEENSVNLFPNPALDFISIQTSFPIEHINIIDTQGKIILTSEKSSTIEIRHLQKGTYFADIHFHNGDKRVLSFIKTN